MTVFKYRVREGFTYGVAGYPAGTILELDDSIAVHSMDMLELAQVVENEGLLPSTDESISPPSEESGQVGQDLAPEEEEEEEEAKVPRARRPASRKSGDD